MTVTRSLLPLTCVLVAATAAGGSAPPIPSTLVPVPAAVDRAPVALLVDLSAGQTLYARDADRRFLPASMTKAMSALIAFDLIATGKLDERSVVTVPAATAAKWQGRGTSLRLAAGQKVTVGELLMGLTTVSANDAAVVLADYAAGSVDGWTGMMNGRAKGLGMTGSHFNTPSGWPDGGKTYVTGRDLVRLAQALIVDHPALYARYFGHKDMSWNGQHLPNHDPFAGTVAGADGIKTGHTFEAGFNFLGAVVRNGRRLVLVAGGSRTETDRANAAKALVEWGYSAWQHRPFLAAGQTVGEIRVQGGDHRTLAVAVPRAFGLTVPRGSNPAVSGTIVYRGPVPAPVSKGQQVAGLRVTIAGQGDHYLPLVATQAVGRAGPIDRLVSGLLGLME